MKLICVLLAALLLAACQGEAAVGFGQIHRRDMGDAVCFVAADLAGSPKSIDCEMK